MRGPAFFAYADNYLIDLKAAVIVDVEASRAVRQAEVGAARTMLERTAERFGLKPERLAADSAYGSAEMLHWLVDEQKIDPHVLVIDKSERQDGTFSRSEFTYDPEADAYTCPEGTTLTTSGRIVNEGTNRLYLGSTFDFCPNTPARRSTRSIYEHAREVARSLRGTPAFERSRQGRKRIEMAATIPNSARLPRKALMIWVRCFTSCFTKRSRARNTRAAACVCSLLGTTKRMVGRWASSQIASASAASFFWRLTNGFTYAGGINRTV
jgi:hypothetical protein